MFLITRLSGSKLFASAFDSAFFQETGNEFDRFLRPATLCRLELLGLACTTDATVKSPERNNLLVLRDIAEVGIRLGQFETC